MGDWVLVIVFAGALSGFGSVQTVDGLTQQQCASAIEWLAPGMGRSATGVCIGPDGQKVEVKP